MKSRSLYFQLQQRVPVPGFDLLKGWQPGNPIVLDIFSPCGQGERLAQDVADIAGVEVVVPKDDDPSQWHVVEPSSRKPDSSTPITDGDGGP
jgi:hypothetical protein